MPAKGFNEARSKTRTMVLKIAGPMSEEALTVALITAQGFATLMTPADLGNLRNSQYRIVRKQGDRVRGEIGYTANYAAYVHEASGKLRGKSRGKGRGTYWSPKGSQPGFLRKAFQGKNRDAIEQAIMSRMTV